jgi:hypothetical protein
MYRGIMSEAFLFYFTKLTVTESYVEKRQILINIFVQRRKQAKLPDYFSSHKNKGPVKTNELSTSPKLANCNQFLHTE